MSAKYVQYGLAFIFVSLGGWCLLFPQMVEGLVFRPAYQEMSATCAVLMACFGAQAMLAGVVIASSEFTARTFLVFGLLGSIPFFMFNAYFYFVIPMFTDWMLLDFVGNAGILACGVMGYRLKLSEVKLA